MLNKGINHNPDVLDCLANLSNDEVFTPPKIANQMLDMLPQELFSNPKTTFLDPACKSGVFLREIAKRLLEGLKDKIPNLEERIEHIYKKQLFGIAITELTSLLSRRSLYCSKYPNSLYSICKFDDIQGNIRFKNYKHTFEKGKCIHCGASEKEYGEKARGEGMESHAYEFIHKNNSEEIFNMKFDVIISNPPYQLNVGNTSGNKSKAKAIYHNFISKAIKLKPKYVIMITPSRWMTKSTEGISDAWVDNMIEGNHIKEINDYPNAAECFPGVEIKGGVSFFLYEENYNGKCKYNYHDPNSNEIVSMLDYLGSKDAGIVIRDPKDLSIIEKIEKIEDSFYKNNNFSGLVSPKDFFTNKQVLTSSWDEYKKEKTSSSNIKYFINKNIHKEEFGWISKNVIPKNCESIVLNKVLIPAAGGSGTDKIILGKPFYAESNSACSQTYLVIGYDSKKHNLSQVECENIVKYIQTKFFRFLVRIKKKTQNGPRGVYQFVPMQNFTNDSDINWSDSIDGIDKQLYKKYDFNKEQINIIENAISPMEIEED